MRIQVRYFAVFREQLGLDGESIDLPDRSTVADAIEALGARHEAVSRLRGRFRVAVNQEMVTDGHALDNGDEIALIPPVAGGSASPRHARMVADVPSLDRVTRSVLDSGMGGLVTFTGLVRRHSQGREVERLEYEAYAEMATRVMAQLCDEIEREVAGSRLAVEHASGVLAVGDIAIVIAAAATHRAEAFTACRALIDRLKERVPIWKKEVGPDGSEWVGLGP